MVWTFLCSLGPSARLSRVSRSGGIGRLPLLSRSIAGVLPFFFFVAFFIGTVDQTLVILNRPCNVLYLSWRSSDLTHPEQFSCFSFINSRPYNRERSAVTSGSPLLAPPAYDTSIWLRDGIISPTYTATVRSAAQRENVQWHLNPPSALHFGGLWKAGIELVKSHLNRVVGEANIYLRSIPQNVGTNRGCSQFKANNSTEFCSRRLTTVTAFTFFNTLFSWHSFWFG